MTVHEGPYLEHHCSSALEAISLLRGEAATLSSGRKPYQWAFRGQANAEWDLIPSALRAGTKLGYYSHRKKYISEGKAQSLEQMDGEIIAIKQFAELADRVGLPLPGYAQFFRQDDLDHNYSKFSHIAGSIIGTDDWPKEEFLELIAFAQHHGVPTRLLDFTYNPLIAIYFAARECASKNSSSFEELAIWGINLEQLNRNIFSVVEVPRSGNPYLHSQKGLFLQNKIYRRDHKDKVSPSLNEKILDSYEKATNKLEEKNFIMFKVCIPTSLAGELVRLLEVEMINRVHLMPSHDNVVAFLNDQQVSEE